MGTPPPAPAVAATTEEEAVGIVVGLPRQLSGGEGRAAELAREYAVGVAQACRPVPVRLVQAEDGSETVSLRLTSWK